MLRLFLRNSFAPTFLELAGVAALPPQIDGRSFADILRPPAPPTMSAMDFNSAVPETASRKPWRTTFLIEHYALADWPTNYQPVRRL